MKAIILAAGQGTRLRPYTNDRPKCMVPIFGKPILHWQLQVMEKVGLSKKKIGIIGGYLKEKLDAPSVTQFYNPDFEKTNMVSTLFCAEQFMKESDDLIISYGDIIYEPKVIQKLIRMDGDICLAADLDWQKLWSLRMDDPLLDAETFKYDENGFVKELGKKPNSYQDAEAQYIGLIKISATKVKEFVQFYKDLDKSAIYDGNDFANMYMTSFIQSLIDNDWKVKACFINNGWIEVDTSDELETYENALANQKNTDIINFNNLD